MLFFLEEFIENVSDYEANMKDKLHDIEKDIYNINDKIYLHTVNMNMSLAEKKDDDEALSIYQFSKHELKQLNERKKKANVELRELKKILASEKKKRSGNADSMENILYIILEESNIKKQRCNERSLL